MKTPNLEAAVSHCVFLKIRSVCAGVWVKCSPSLFISICVPVGSALAIVMLVIASGYGHVGLIVHYSATEFIVNVCGLQEAAFHLTRKSPLKG
jgi:hypothetical protein